MPKKIKTVEDHLQTISYLLAGILMKKETDIRTVAKIVGCSDKVLYELYPEKRQVKNNVKR